MKRSPLRPISARRLAELRRDGQRPGLARRTRLSPGAVRLSRGSRIKPVNPKRKAERYAVAFGDKSAWIREMACGICFAPAPSDPHHVKTRGAGGTSADLVPLCRRCHREGHAIGWVGFKVELRMLAAELEARWNGKGSE